MTKKDLDKQHNANCAYIAEAINCLDLDNCVEWDKIQQSKTDDLSSYMKKVYLNKKEQNNDN